MELLSAKQVASMMGVTPSTIRDYYRRGIMPARVALPTKVLRWDRKEIEQWLAGRK